MTRWLWQMVEIVAALAATMVFSKYILPLLCVFFLTSIFCARFIYALVCVCVCAWLCAYVSLQSRLAEINDTNPFAPLFFSTRIPNIMWRANWYRTFMSKFQTHCLLRRDTVREFVYVVCVWAGDGNTFYMHFLYQIYYF